LYGHMEVLDERVDHLERLRAAQDETPGFQSFIPLAFHPENTRIRQGKFTTGFDDLKNIAIGRIFLDNFPHIKSFWVMQGVKIAQVSLSFGADDLNGTVAEERITHEAGATTPEALARDQLVALIREAGREPVERDTVYNVVEECRDRDGPAALWRAPQGVPILVPQLQHRLPFLESHPGA
ncbi:MAG: hypothetical protein ACE5JM_11090, partial [Armatimonadota bacterium]